MIIKKMEKVEFSPNELRCVEMTIMLMETISANATHPDLIRLSEQVHENLGAIYDRFVDGA